MTALRPAAATTAMTTGKPETTKRHASHTRHDTESERAYYASKKENPTQRQWTEHRVPACPPNFLDLT